MAERILPACTPDRPADSRRDSSWRALAACRDADTELFFPEGFTGPAAVGICAAKAICGRCPARDRCLAYALDTGQTAGIWGGTDENERRIIHQQRRPVRTASPAAGPRP